ncbi:MAG TPA: anaerobic ribonucleoside-triphosphate reductase activating protein [Firmicutes bacterium]|nr:anaerobic ribonucleoside-triphosphate reductase activating protein [Bacillota bacterium]
MTSYAMTRSPSWHDDAQQQDFGGNRPAALCSGGLQKLSLVDFPGMVCATVFLRGCNLRCPYCHNPDLVLGSPDLPCIPEEELLRFLESRRGFIDGVCVSGGEPTLEPGLPGFLTRVKALGFQAKLDTNGTRPDVLRQLLECGLLDYVAMDVKAPPDKYRTVTRSQVDPYTVEESMRLLQHSEIDHEFRTTVVPGLVSAKDVEAIARWLQGAHRYVLQPYWPPRKTLDESWEKPPPCPHSHLERLARCIAQLVARVEVRNPAWPSVGARLYPG